MSDPIVVQITNGVIAFKRVDTAAVGYLPTWNAPAGKTAITVTMADYETGSATWSCQITSGMLTAAGDTGTTTEVAATFCAAARSIPAPGVTAYTLDVELLQDPTVASPTKGISQYLFEEDTYENYFMLGLNGPTAGPRAVGRVRMIAGSFGGAARTALTATLSLPVTQKPSIAFGTTLVFEDEGLSVEESELANA